MAASLSLCIWLYLFFGHGKFWSSTPQLPPGMPTDLPEVDIIVPARDEAQTIAPVVSSLLAQDYAGKFRVILVDDGSTDGTASLAGSADALQIIAAAPKRAGWSGKLWALSQGIALGSAPLLLLTDADIVHDRRHLATLIARLQQQDLQLVSEMVFLNCTSLAERALIPAFVYFFQMLYPFARVNDPHSRLAAAAGGTILIRREALERSGGLAAIKHALIDDVALARAVKRVGPIYLGHSGLAASLRPYPHFSDIWRMITRTAYTQLHHSLLLLALALAALAIVWLVPVWEMLFGHGWRSAFGLAAYAFGVVSYLPTLARYRQSKLWALGLPLIGLFYMAATLGSAANEWLGRGARWKDRHYAGGERLD